MADEKKTVEIQIKTTGDADLKRIASTITGLRKEAAASRKALDDMAKSTEHLGHSASNISHLLSFREISHAVREAAEWFHHLTEEMDGILKASQKFGISTDDIQRLQYAAKFAGVGMEGLQVAVVKLSKNMAAMGEKTGPVIDKLKAAGITAKTGTYEALTKIADVFKGMPDGAEKTAMAVELFGKAGASLIPMLNKGHEALQGWSDELDHMNGIIDHDALEAAERFNDAIIKMQATAKKAESQLAAGMAPAFAQIAEAIQQSIDVGGGWKEFGEGLGEVAKFLYRIFQVLVIVFKQIGERIGAVAASVHALFTGHPIEAWRIQMESAADSTKNLKDAWGSLTNDLPKPKEGGHGPMTEEQAKEQAQRDAASKSANDTMAALESSIALQKQLTAAAKESAEAYRKVKEAAEVEAEVKKIMEKYDDAGVENAEEKEKHVRATVLAEREAKAQTEAALEATKKHNAELEKQAKARAEALKSANEMVSKLRESVQTQQDMARAAEQSASQMENQKQQAEDEAEAEKIIAEYRKAGVKNLEEQARVVRELIAVRREAKAEADQSLKDQKDFEDSMKGQLDQLQVAVDKTVEVRTAWTDFLEAADLTEDGIKKHIQNFASGLVDYFSGAEKSFGRFLKKFLAGMAQMIAQQLIYNSISSALFPAKSATGRVMDTPTLPQMEPGGPMTMRAAVGGAFGPGGVMAFAAGGVVSRPTMFRFAGGAGLMGEAGPEAIMPLRRGADGKLGVSATKSNVIIENHAAPVTATVDNDGNEMRIILRAARMGADMAVSRVNQSVSSGYGSTASSMQRTYGLRRRT